MDQLRQNHSVSFQFNPDKPVYSEFEGAELNAEDLDQVVGGMILNATGLPECEPGKPWEVIHNNNGMVLSRWSTKDEACEPEG